MRRTIATFLRECQEDELALLYISGHGTRPVTSESEFFFVTADTGYGQIGQTGVGAQFVNECLEDCWAAQKIAILDCCRSGGFALGFRTRETTAKSAQAQPETRSPSPRRAFTCCLPLVPVRTLSPGAAQPASRNPRSSLRRSSRRCAPVAPGVRPAGTSFVDELFDAVGDRLRQDEALQKPVKSAFAVNGRIDVTRRPHDKSSELTPVRRGPAAEQPIRSEPAAADPDWPTLLAHYRDAVLTDAGTQQLKPSGPVIPHPGLARSLLDDDQAKALAASYQPSWHTSRATPPSGSSRHTERRSRS